MGAELKEGWNVCPTLRQVLQKASGEASEEASRGRLSEMGGVKVRGWVRTVRQQKRIAFIEINDGSMPSSLQCVVDGACDFSVGSSVEVEGELVAHPREEGVYELQVKSAKHIRCLGESPVEEYPLQKKEHSFEFLRSLPHLRVRTKTLGSVMRVRSRLTLATHRFFQERNFFHVATPIITASDCEGAGDQFPVDTKLFGQPVFLTVSGQLEAEPYACALSRVYTFGPTFRSENSNTSRHLAEFWMVEPEVAHAELGDVIALAEQYLHEMVRVFFEECSDEWSVLGSPEHEETLRAAQAPLQRLTYTDAVALLESCQGSNQVRFEHPCSWGCDLQSEHEKFLCRYLRGPVAVTDYPQDRKPFYMRQNGDGKTVAAMDVLVPGIGEMIGGSQREERFDVLEQAMVHHFGPSLTPHLKRYLDLRKFGTIPHGGFGLGFERLVQWLTGMSNIREVIPYPRVPGYAE